MPTAFAQQPVREFSADTVSHDPAGNPLPGKIYRGTSMVRMDDLSPGGGPDSGTFGIVDLAQNIRYAVSPGRKLIMVSHLRDTGISEFLLPVGDLCASLGASASDGTCKNLGPDPVNGRQTVKWQITIGGQTVTVWVDPQLRAFIKVVLGGGTSELRNIHEGPQPAKLFEIPASYRRMDLGGR